MQLFANLAENALLHCPEGASIRLKTHKKCGQISVSVADDGPGILPENRERIFKRFVRTDSSRSSTENGLGLTLAKAIAEMQGAVISVEDSAVGATFLTVFQLKNTSDVLERT
jgi:signal transduction histidine kinase